MEHASSDLEKAAHTGLKQFITLEPIPTKAHVEMILYRTKVEMAYHTAHDVANIDRLTAEMLEG